MRSNFLNSIDIQAALTVIGRRADGPGEADLSGANIPAVNLVSADLTNASLGGANLTRSTLSSAILIGANLSSVHLTANLSGVDLTRRQSERGNLPP